MTMPCFARVVWMDGGEGHLTSYVKIFKRLSIFKIKLVMDLRLPSTTTPLCTQLLRSSYLLCWPS